MKVILTIGHTDILLPDDKGVATVLKVLSRGVRCEDRLYNNTIIVTDDPLAMEMKMVLPKVRVLYPAKPLPLLERTMEDHGTEPHD